MMPTHPRRAVNADEPVYRVRMDEDTRRRMRSLARFKRSTPERMIARIMKVFARNPDLVDVILRKE